jgi:hypothetical protein
MTDETPNDCPGYEITLTVRDDQGQLLYRVVKPVVWQLDAFATRDDGVWSQANKRETLFAKIGEAEREVRTWLRGRNL